MTRGSGERSIHAGTWRMLATLNKSHTAFAPQAYHWRWRFHLLQGQQQALYCSTCNRLIALVACTLPTRRPRPATAAMADMGGGSHAGGGGEAQRLSMRPAHERLRVDESILPAAAQAAVFDVDGEVTC